MPDRDWQKDWELVCEAQAHNDLQSWFQHVLDVCIYWLLWVKDAMDRVRELEEENSRLKQDLQDELWYQEDREKAVADMIKQLEDENHRLRAVAEAAREFAEAFKQDAGFDDWFERCWDKQIELEKALAALGEGEPNEVHQVQDGR